MSPGASFEYLQTDMDEKQGSSFWQAVAIAWQMGYTIALPLIGFALLGRFLDNKLGTTPWLLIIGAVLAILTSTFLLVSRFRSILDKMNQPPKQS